MKKLKIIIPIILALGILLIIPSNSMAKVYTQTITSYGYTIKITVDSDKNYEEKYVVLGKPDWGQGIKDVISGNIINNIRETYAKAMTEAKEIGTQMVIDAKNEQIQKGWNYVTDEGNKILNPVDNSTTGKYTETVNVDGMEVKFIINNDKSVTPIFTIKDLQQMSEGVDLVEFGQKVNEAAQRVATNITQDEINEWYKNHPSKTDYPKTAQSKTVNVSGFDVKITVDPTNGVIYPPEIIGLDIKTLTEQGINVTEIQNEAYKLAKEWLEELLKEEIKKAKENSQEERTDSTKVETTTISLPVRDLTGLTKGGIAAGNNVFCIEAYNTNIPETDGKNNVIVVGNKVNLSETDKIIEGIVLGKGNYPKTGTISASATMPSQGMVLNDTKYNKKTEEILGKTYESAAIAYLCSRVQDAVDNGKGLENYLQVALWNLDYHNLNEGKRKYKWDGGLEEEAKAYQKYREEIEKWKKRTGDAKKDLVVKDNVIDHTVSVDLKEKKYYIGPYTVDYVRGYANISGREFVDFGGLKEIKLYDQDGKEIPSDAWEIEFPKDRKIDEADKEYLSKFPSGKKDKFYIKLYEEKLPEGTKKISKISYVYYELNIQAKAMVCEGSVTKADTWKEVSKILGTKINTIGGVARPVTTYQYNAVPVLKRVNAQTVMMIVEVTKDTKTTTTDVPTINQKKYPANPTSLPTVWPYWPSTSRDPSYPDGDLTFTIAGIVWEDTKTGKESNFDGKIGTANSDEKESGIQNVEVKLYEHGSTNVIKTTYTNSTGAYMFNDLPIGRYDVGFVYDGLTYKTTKSFASGSSSDYVNNPNDEKYQLDSKAEETESDRQAFNDKFYEITADGAKNSSGTITNTEALEYITLNGVSTIKTTDSEGKVKKDFQLETKTTNSLSVGFPFSDYVNNESTNKVINGQTYYANYEYMAYVNLGLQKREEVDFALTKDVYTSTVTINSKEINYKYNARSADSFDIGLKQSVSYNNVKYNREVYKSDYNYRIDDYKSNSLNVSGSELRGLKDEDQELKVFVTYKIKVRNQSAIYSGTINQLVDYFDSTYKLVTSDEKLDIRNDNGTIEKNKVVAKAPYYETSLGVQGILNVTTPEIYNSQYNKTYISGIENNILQTGEDIYLYLTFEVDKDSTRAVKLGEKSNQVEITSYSTFEQNAISKTKTVGMIDRDSAPGNLNPSDSSTLEDDSDIAPTINIKLNEDGERTLNGVVWEDNKTDISGDGIRQDSETKINGVRVQLIEIITASNGQQYEYIWQEMYTGESGYKYVDINGNIFDANIGQVKAGTTETERGIYKFSGYIPGDYIVRFIYGDTTKTILTGKNDKSYNGQDYKSTTYWEGNNIYSEWYDLSSSYLNNTALSDAKDNEARRLAVNEYSKVMKNSIAKVLASHEQDTDNYDASLHNELIDKTWMYADTAKMRVEVEYNTTTANGLEDINSYNIRDIDFGLVKRPENKIDLNKEIVGIKITLADGSTLVDTEAGIKKNVNIVKNSARMQGKIHIYMDEEVMQGANIQIKYKITVTNNGEKDYTGATSSSVGTAYYTGKVSASDKLVTTSVDIIADYVDNSIVYRAEENEGKGWTPMDQTSLGSIAQMEEQGYLDKDVKLEEKNIHQILINDSLKNMNLTPGESKTVELTLSKTISSADEDNDLSYDNIAEVLQFTNTVGRRADLPGNQDPTEAPTEDDSDWTETVIITPPTGENRSHYYVLAGVVLVITGLGVFVIKKKVLDK